MRIKDILNYLTTINIGFSFHGNENDSINGFSSLNNYKAGSFTWIKSNSNLKNKFNLKDLKLVFISDDVEGDFINYIRCSDSKRAFFATIEHFYYMKRKPGIGTNTYIASGVIIGKNVSIGSNCVLDGKIVLGDNVILGNNISIVNSVYIGDNTEIQSGCVIGHAGMGYTINQDGIKIMVKHFGGVNIGSNVFIGANSIISQGTIDDTIIGNGTKISCGSSIGHNDIIGQNCTIISSTLYGSCHIGDNSYLSHCLVKNQVDVGVNVIIGMGSVVLKDIMDNQTVLGNPARPFPLK